MENQNQNPPSNENNNDENCNTSPEYPPCPPPVEQEKCEPTFVPINLEVCPIIKVMVNKPKICLQNKAESTPCFFLNNCQNN